LTVLGLGNPQATSPVAFQHGLDLAPIRVKEDKYGGGESDSNEVAKCIASDDPRLKEK
jgi:hypothetical protein